MRRLLHAVLLVGISSAISFATESYSTTETLVGWSEDGDTYAVVSAASSMEPAQLVVRQGTANKQVASWKDGDKGVPEESDKGPGVQRIDVQKWEPLKKYKLKLVDATARAKFKTDYELATIGKQLDRYHCKNGGWTLKRKSDAKVITEIKAKGDHCFAVLGGYVHPSGKRALVKLTELSWTTSKDGDSSSDDTTSFVLVELPAK